MKARTVPFVLALAVVTAAVAAPAITPDAGDVRIVTGHTAFADMSGMDPCLAAVAGLVKNQVLWFDDSIFHERTNFEDDRYLYASEENASDPTAHVSFDESGPLEGDADEIKENADQQMTDKVLVRSGVWYNFTDPNGVTWNVTEVFWDDTRNLPNSNVQTGGGTGGNEGGGEAIANASTNRHYAWIVKIGPTTPDAHSDGLDHERYNFVNMVNSCKFSTQAERDNHIEHDPPNRTDDKSGPPGFRHPEQHQEEHFHEAWNVKLRVGEEPDTFNLDAEPANGVTTKTVEQFAQEADDT